MLKFRLLVAATLWSAAFALSPAQTESDWRVLFDGTSLKGWVQRGGHAAYEVRDGMIVCTAAREMTNTFLCTEDEYSDFILELEFWIDPGMNSGVQIRSHSRADFRDGTVHGYQVELDGSERRWTGGIYDEGRRGWLQPMDQNPAVQRAVLMKGDAPWNRLRVEARGDHIRTWLNGYPAGNLHDSMTGSGFIALQGHATASTGTLQVRWRNIRVMELPAPASVTGHATPEDGAAVPLRFRVDAGDYVRTNTPMALVLDPDKIPSGPTSLFEVQADGTQRPVAAQLDLGETTTLAFVLDGVTPAASSREYVFKTSEGVEETASDVVRVAENQDTLVLSRRANPVVSYQHGVMPAPEPDEGLMARSGPIYERSGFIHPLWSPTGAVLTQIQPWDHIHHYGLWHPWTKTEFEGRPIDFWNLYEGQGTVRFAEFSKKTSGPVWGGFTARQEHVDLMAPDRPKVALDEHLTVRLWNVTDDTPTTSPWVLDYRISQRPAAGSPLTVLKYHYGGLGFRARADWGPDNGYYLTSEGKTRQDADGTRARWCDVSGRTENGIEGILFMSHPMNREHPEPVRIWNNPFGVFFDFCPVGEREWIMEPGKDHVLSYRMIGHNGEMNAEESERLWRDFAYPPQVIFLSKSKELES